MDFTMLRIHGCKQALSRIRRFLGAYESSNFNMPRPVDSSVTR